MISFDFAPDAAVGEHGKAGSGGWIIVLCRSMWLDHMVRQDQVALYWTAVSAAGTEWHSSLSLLD